MGKKKVFLTVLSGVLVGGMIISGGMAFADGETKSAATNLVGKIPFFNKVLKWGGPMGNKGLFKGAGPLAQEQKQQQISDTLKTLVEKGTITQEQSDKILQRYADAEKERETLSQKMEDMTLKEIRQYMQDNRGKPQDPLSQLVAEGVITQEQADAFQVAMKETVQKQNQQRIADSLNALADKGTITREQADKIFTELEGIKKDQAALAEKLKNMTPEERRQYKQDNKEKLQDPLGKLVADGVITQEQAKAVREIICQAGPAGLKGPIGWGGPGGQKGPRGGGKKVMPIE